MLIRMPLSRWPLLLGGLLLLGGNPLRAQADGQAIEGDPVHGKKLYANCTGCHSIDENDVGPKHRGVVGRKAGTVPDYDYSPALKASGIIWNKETLDRWLTNPSAMVPGTKMFFVLEDPKARADIIAYLSLQGAK